LPAESILGADLSSSVSAIAPLDRENSQHLGDDVVDEVRFAVVITGRATQSRVA
jgi:hypothetical protein